MQNFHRTFIRVYNTCFQINKLFQLPSGSVSQPIKLLTSTSTLWKCVSWSRSMVSDTQVTVPYYMLWNLVFHFLTACAVEIQLSASVQPKGFSLLSIQGERVTMLYVYTIPTLQLFQLLHQEQKPYLDVVSEWICTSPVSFWEWAQLHIFLKFHCQPARNRHADYSELHT